MTTLAIILAVTAALLAVALLRGAQLLRDERSRRQRLEDELAAVSVLMEVLHGSDWLRSLHGLLTGIVQQGSARAAALYATTDVGTLELRASTQVSGEPEWGVTDHPMGVYQALESKVVCRTADSIYFPLLEESEVIGLLAVRGGQQDAVVLQVVSRLAALALNEIRVFRRQAALSSTDGLTGLANHRHFQQTLSIAIGQVYLESDPLALLLLDIDHFKRVNDTHGHQLGDLVLREIGYLLRSLVPPGSLVARYGGEEMAVLLQGESANRAPSVAETIRSAIAAHEFRDFQTGAKLQVTVSLGVANYELGEGKNRFIARSDAALYASKHNGRNRVSVAPVETVSR